MSQVKKKCFTLIELLVVVFIMAIISGLLLPMLVKIKDKSRQMAQETQQKTDQIQMQAQQKTLQFQPPQGILPILDSTELKMQLSSSNHRLGMDVFTRYELQCSGELKFHHPGDQKGPILLAIPFPESITEARDVKLTLKEGDNGTPKEPDNVIYHHKGIFWTGEIPEGKKISAQVTFVAVGREHFIYLLPASRQMRSVDIILDLKEVSSPLIPDNALQPTQKSPQKLRWQFKSLVSNRPIVIEIPGTRSPIGRVMLLFRLVAVAVLLFGVGLWYLGEQQKPGLLDNFRWGHFLLLALTYSLFFIIFSVLGLQETMDTQTAMGISAVFSLPLLILHVSRVVGFKFAITRMFPLTIFTLALVINGVYGGEMRDYVFIGGTIFVIGYLTFTYDKWSSRREGFRKEKEEKLAERKKLITQKITNEIGEWVAKAENRTNEARVLLQENDKGEMQLERQRLYQEQKYLSEILKDFELLTPRLAHLPTTIDWEHSISSYKSLEEEATQFQERLQQSLENLEHVLLALKKEKPPAKSQKKKTIYCTACGKSGPASSFCQECGIPRTTALSCKKCKTSLTLPIHILDKKRIPSQLHCPGCGIQQEFAFLKQLEIREWLNFKEEAENLTEE